MKLFPRFLPVALFLSGVLSMFAGGAEIISPVPDGTSLLGQVPDSVFKIYNNPDLGTSRRVEIAGAPFVGAIELAAFKQPANPWDYQTVAIIPAAIHKGDVIWVSLWMRTLKTGSESGEGVSEISIEQASPPFDHLGTFALAAGREWKQFAASCTATSDLGPGQAQICLRGGYKPQVIQFGGIQLLDYGTTVKGTDLPRSKITWSGMEANAPWRKAAEERIERIRKADIRIKVTDSAGKPLAGADVRIKQLRHEFGFGSCVVASLIEGKNPDDAKYRSIISNNFSKIVMENDLKWVPWETWNREGNTLAALKWLREQGIPVRGHNLVWPSWQMSPPDLGALRNDKAALERRIEDHITNEVGATKGLLTEWDVVNEPYGNHDILDLLGPDIMVTWFKLVHQLDPQPVLFLNDYAGLMDRGENSPHKDAFEKTLRSLKDNGAPIGGLGIQAHFGDEFTGPEQILRELDRWAALGLEIQITEFDINTEDEQAQAAYTRDFMTAVFSHPAVSALLTWGFWEGADWIPSAALYRRDWSIKPNGQVWNDLVLKQWHTDVAEKTGPSGEVSTRGFMGQYEITVTSNGVTKSWPLTLPRQGATFTAVIPVN